jgi:hypothetical protein
VQVVASAQMPCPQRPNSESAIALDVRSQQSSKGFRPYSVRLRIAEENCAHKNDRWSSTSIARLAVGQRACSQQSIFGASPSQQTPSDVPLVRAAQAANGTQAEPPGRSRCEPALRPRLWRCAAPRRRCRASRMRPFFVCAARRAVHMNEILNKHKTQDALQYAHTYRPTH